MSTVLTASAVVTDLQAHFHGYAVAGDPSVPMHGDYYAGKGIGHAVLQTSAGLLSVFNTHTCANYSHKYKGGNACLCAAVYFATLLLNLLARKPSLLYAMCTQLAGLHTVPAPPGNFFVQHLVWH